MRIWVRVRAYVSHSLCVCGKGLHVCVYGFVRMCLRVYAYVCKGLCVCVFGFVSMCVWVCVYVCMGLCVSL